MILILKTPIKRKEYFDPSVISQTIYFHDAKGNLTHETTSGYLGASLDLKHMNTIHTIEELKKLFIVKKAN